MVGEPVGSSVELSVAKRFASERDCSRVWASADLLFEERGNGLILGIIGLGFSPDR